MTPPKKAKKVSGSGPKPVPASRDQSGQPQTQAVSPSKILEKQVADSEVSGIDIESLLELDQEKVLQGIILAEVLGKPKALRRGRG